MCIIFINIYNYVKSEKVGVSSLDLLSHMLLYTQYKTQSDDHDNFQWKAASHPTEVEKVFALLDLSF